jgi:hypothetical protein
MEGTNMTAGNPQFAPTGSRRCLCNHRELGHADSGKGKCFACACDGFQGAPYDIATARFCVTDVSKWHNTGGNGQASQVWERQTSGLRHAVIVQMYRCVVDLWRGSGLEYDHVGFDSLDEAKAYADKWLDAP